MTAIDKIPLNRNFLSPQGFQFFVRRAPTVNFFVQTVNGIPGLMIPPPLTENPFVTLPYAGDHILYNELDITFRVSEDLENYLEIYRWMKGLGFPDNWDQYKDISSQQPLSGYWLKSDITILILTSAKNPAFEVLIKDAFPIQLSDLRFDAMMGDTTPVEASAVFKYTSYEINPI